MKQRMNIRLPNPTAPPAFQPHRLCSSLQIRLSPPNPRTEKPQSPRAAIPMDGDGDSHGGAPAKRAKLSPAAGPGSGLDRISDLPNHVLLRILLHLPIAGAAQSSVLSSRWRGVWVQLPVFDWKCPSPDAGLVRAALTAHAAHAAPDIHCLSVSSSAAAAPDSTASWLRLAAPRLAGDLYFHNRCDVPEEILDKELSEEVMVGRGALELPCFKKATKICLRLGFLGLALPPSAVFVGLKELYLERVRFQSQCTLDDTMCPSLQQLLISKSRGLVDLVLSSKSLVRTILILLRGLQRFKVMAPRLKALNMSYCFRGDLQAADIAAEGLEELRWADSYDPTLVRFGEMPCLQLVCPSHVYPYGPREMYDQDCGRFLKHFSSTHQIELLVTIRPDLGNLRPLMEGITSLPDIKILSLVLASEGHVFGATVSHLLTIFPGIRELNLRLPDPAEFKVQNACSLDCICDQPPSWRSQDILLKVLKEVEISNFRGVEYEVDFVKLLFKTAPALERMRITCHHSLTAWEKLSEDLRGFASPETSVEVIPFLQPVLE